MGYTDISNPNSPNTQIDITKTPNHPTDTQLTDDTYTTPKNPVLKDDTKTTKTKTTNTPNKPNFLPYIENKNYKNN